MKAFERTKYLLLFGLYKSPSSFTYRWAMRRLNVSLQRMDIMQAAGQLALYHRIYGIEIRCKTLARLLGMSKSSLYLPTVSSSVRRFAFLVKEPSGRRNGIAILLNVHVIRA